MLQIIRLQETLASPISYDDLFLQTVYTFIYIQWRSHV